MSLATKYLGLTLKNPLVASASPLNSKLDNLRRLEDAGAAAIVLPSLFQEQIEAEAENQASRVEAYAESSPEARLTFRPRRTGRTVCIRIAIWIWCAAQAGGLHPGHRQPERILTRRLDRMRET